MPQCGTHTHPTHARHALPLKEWHQASLMHWQPVAVTCHASSTANCNKPSNPQCQASYPKNNTKNRMASHSHRGCALSFCRAAAAGRKDMFGSRMRMHTKCVTVVPQASAAGVPRGALYDTTKLSCDTSRCRLCSSRRQHKVKRWMQRCWGELPSLQGPLSSTQYAQTLQLG